MAVPTAESIQLKITEYARDESEFIRHYANGHAARTAFILQDDKLYDLKALWAAAHEPPVVPRSFHTNDARAGVQQFGFQVFDAAEARSYREGARRQKEISFFSRNPGLVRKAIGQYGTACMCCGFDFGHTYGDHGRGYIECHHLRPLSMNEERDTPLKEVAVLCANCHRMIHRHRDRPLTIRKLKEIVGKPRTR
jgi:hypothetical protein